jgi:hypothetical protein
MKSGPPGRPDCQPGFPRGIVARFLPPAFSPALPAQATTSQKKRFNPPGKKLPGPAEIIDLEFKVGTRNN